MKQALNCILLIDDEEPVNYLHKLIIEQTGYVKNIVTMQNAKQALNLINSKEEEKLCRLIFLDINMPGMNGWEFLDKYNELDIKHREEVVIVMLTTSLDPDDREKAKNIKEIREFRSKPLTKGVLEEICEKYFCI
ncbi:hypothetical protein Lupro_04015 [Lutibacter profundi]|uniref:Response regulatory domain-containing protein n=1 Tax=Lutibacter profundi TaxID=1622118 RepID=A0A0X8G5J0_9FLAO|nr:response regulator [Lutibacter profundi]AMC10468.1 hypothetical protein Lupro_04015 [Lutibacter profundi]